MNPIHFPLTVRTKILLIFLCLALTTLLVIGITAFFTIGDMGTSARENSALLGREAIRDSTAALESGTEDYLLRVATDQARLIDEIFWETEMELNLLADYAVSAQGNTSHESSVRSYPADHPPENPLDGTTVLISPGATVTANDEEFKALAGMDDLLTAVYHNDGDLTAVYVATDSGIMRAYPGDGGAAPDYDPRTRPWFTAARGSTAPVWTAPYIDAYGHGLIVTCARNVQTRYGTWVVASDVTIDQLNDYTSLTLGGKGYAVLMDNGGTIIARPGLAINTTLVDPSYTAENVFASGNPDLVAIGTNMTAGKTGIEWGTINGNETVVAYAPIAPLNMSYAVSVPAAEITAPIRNTEGQIALATAQTNKEIADQTARILRILALLFLLTLIVVVGLSWFLARMITRPVVVLKEGAAAIGAGDLAFRVDIRSGDEFEDLAGSFNRMAADLRASIDDLKVTTAQKERYHKEMEIAREIQNSFLPESVPQIPGCEIAAANIPAMEIGGDLYDFIAAGPGREGFVIADVSGKGVSAALYMAVSATLLHASGEAEADPSRALWNANRLLENDSRSGMFITVFYGVLSTAERTFTYANGGHNPPLVVGPGGTASWLDRANGIALGVVPEVSIVPETVALEPGSVLVLYTDGVTEAFNERDEYFGEDRLKDCVTRNGDLPVQDLLAALLAEIRAFTGTAPQSDDITLVVVRIL